MSKVFGIDLGTTNSCIAHVTDSGIVKVLENREGKYTTPSVIFFERDANPVVGENAKQSLSTDPDRVVEVIKRHMGKPNWSFSVDNIKYSAEQLSAIILKRIADDASSASKTTVKDVVITCPAYFKDAERNATKQAGIIAGLNVLAIINEPTAACCNYVLQSEDKVLKNVLVYDLGGGTFDVSFVKIDTTGEKKIIEVISSEGNPELGGKNWDQLIRDYVIKQMSTQIGTDTMTLKDDIELMCQLSVMVEDVKTKLSSKVKDQFKFRYNGDLVTIPFTRETFDELTKALLQSTVTFIDRLLSDVENAQPQDCQFSEIVLVGGSTRMPQVQELLKNKFPDKTLVIHEPDQAVAKGAAIYASMISKFKKSEENHLNNKYGKDDNSDNNINIEMTEVLNNSYGIKLRTMEGKFIISNVLFKNTKLDVIKGTIGTLEAATISDNQKALQIEIFESQNLEKDFDYDESMKAIYEHTFHLENALPKSSPIEITFFIDPSGILHVTAVDQKYNQEIHCTIKGNIKTAKELNEERLELANMNID